MGRSGHRSAADRTRRQARVAGGGGVEMAGGAAHLHFLSPLVRALETADILLASMSIPSAIKRVDELLPDANPERLLAVFRDLAPECTVLCVGHEPHLGLAASMILAGKPSSAFPFKKAGACLIELSEPLKVGRGVLRWWMEPGQLRALGKKKAKLEA